MIYRVGHFCFVTRFKLFFSSCYALRYQLQLRSCISMHMVDKVLNMCIIVCRFVSKRSWCVVCYHFGMVVTVAMAIVVLRL